MNVKETLINYNLCVDNEYLDKYVQLIDINTHTEKEINRTQSHHIIPISYYSHLYNLSDYHEAKQFADADLNNYTVHLLYKDHILAHCYLALCAKETWFKYGNANMIHWVEHKLSLAELAALADLDIYQQTYELSRLQIKDQNINPFVFSDHYNIQRGKLYVHTSTEITVISPDEISEYLANDWRLGRTDCKRCYIHKDGLYIQINKNDLQSYLDAGWIYGAAGKPRSPAKSSHYLEQTKLQVELADIRKTNKSAKRIHNIGTAIIHKENHWIYINPTDFLDYYKDGWLPGKRDTEKCWVHLLDRAKLIAITKLDSYLQQGWLIGAAGRKSTGALRGRPKKGTNSSRYIKNETYHYIAEEKRKLRLNIDILHSIYTDMCKAYGKNSKEAIAAQHDWKNAIAKWQSFCLQNKK